MSEISNKAVASVADSAVSMCKFITANDAGATGGHQAGFHIHKNTHPVFFDSEGVKGQNKENFITIKWQDDFETESRAIYYGQGTRNEYRLTRFGRGFPFLQEENIGDLLIISKMEDGSYNAFVLQTEEDIEDFLSAYNMSPVDTNGIIDKAGLVGGTVEEALTAYVAELEQFPTTKEMARLARQAFNQFGGIDTQKIIADPDKVILDWITTEFDLFLLLENKLSEDVVRAKYEDTTSFIEAANAIANRRKSRAGKSLEHHLEAVFNAYELRFDTQATTEGNKHPDFLFPGEEEYHDNSFATELLIFLAAKTTCKDRWRQILNEADRINSKHLFTLQQGISSNQLTEMYENEVCVVVPQVYKTTFPAEFRDRILSLENFVGVIRQTQSK